MVIKGEIHNRDTKGDAENITVSKVKLFFDNKGLSVDVKNDPYIAHISRGHSEHIDVEIEPHSLEDLTGIGLIVQSDKVSSKEIYSSSN